MGVAASTVVKIIVNTPMTTAGGAGTASKDFKDPRERHPRGRPSAGPRWYETSDSSYTSSHSSRRDRRRRSRRCRKEKTQDRSAEPVSRASYSSSSDPKRIPTFYGIQATTAKQMVRDAFARAEAEERSGQPGRQVL